MSRKRLLSVALVVAIVAACGGGAATDESTTTVPASTATEAAVATTTTAAAPTTSEALVTTTVPDDTALRAAWALTAVEHRGDEGAKFTYECPPSNALIVYSVWGTGTYTDDSSVCTAGVHAGLITIEDGGTLTIEMRPGEAAYDGTVANGITSGDWGAWSSSFVFDD